MVAKESTRHQEKINGGTHLDDTAFPSCPSYYSVAVDARNDTDTTGLYRICALLSKAEDRHRAGSGHWALGTDLCHCHRHPRSIIREYS